MWADTIAHRGWHAWWTESGVSLADYRAHLKPMTEREGVPLALVAHANGVYLGSALVIECDLDDRPEYAPGLLRSGSSPMREDKVLLPN